MGFEPPMVGVTFESPILAGSAMDFRILNTPAGFDWVLELSIPPDAAGESAAIFISTDADGGPPSQTALEEGGEQLQPASVLTRRFRGGNPERVYVYHVQTGASNATIIVSLTKHLVVPV